METSSLLGGGEATEQAENTSPTITEAVEQVQADVDELRALLDLMAEFRDNDQRARYLLSSNWMRDRLARRQSDAELLDALYKRLAGLGAAK